jgi:hypothetical protein
VVLDRRKGPDQPGCAPVDTVSPVGPSLNAKERRPAVITSPPCDSRALCASGLLLVGGWIGLAILLSTLLQPPPGDDDSGFTGHDSPGSWYQQLDVAGVDPCTDESFTVAAGLSVEVLNRSPREPSIVDVRRERVERQTSSITFEPQVRHVAAYSTVIPGVPYLHAMRTPLDAPYVALDLVVELQGGVGENGWASFSLGGARIDSLRSPCAGPPSGPPDRPVTVRLGFPAFV